MRNRESLTEKEQLLYLDGYEKELEKIFNELGAMNARREVAELYSDFNDDYGKWEDYDEEYSGP